MTDPKIINKRMRFYFRLKLIGLLITLFGIFLAIKHPLDPYPYFYIFILLGLLFAYVVFIFQRLEMGKLDPEYKSKIAAQRKTFLIGWTAILIGIFISFVTFPESGWPGLILGFVLIILGIFTRDGNRAAFITTSAVLGFLAIFFLFIMYKFSMFHF